MAAWSPAGWPAEGLPAAPDAALTPERQERYNAELTALEAAREDAAAVRRVHANIPILTIFDDHEVTDDWNLTRNWRDGVRNNPLGRRIVANGLAAYWAFQGWGNDPAAFAPPSPFIDTIVNRSTRDDFDGALWDFTGWSYALPTIPTVIALDTRTRRAYDGPGEAARLMNTDALDTLNELWNDVGMGPRGSLILLSGAPIFGFDIVEDLQRLAGMFTRAETVDHESWYANKDGYADLMTALTDRLRPYFCIVLSGDVHYSFSNDADFICNGSGLIVAQLTASAFKNESGAAPALTFLGNAATKVETRVGAMPGDGSPNELSVLAMQDSAERWHGTNPPDGELYWYDRTRSVRADGDGNHHVTTASFGDVEVRFYNADGEDIVGPGISLVYHRLHAAPETDEAAVTFTHDGPMRGYIAPDDD